MSAIVVDIGGTNLRFGVVNDDGTITSLEKKKVQNVFLVNSVDVVWEKLIFEIISYEKKVEQKVVKESPFIISFPGPIEGGYKIISSPTLIGDFENCPSLIESLNCETGRKTILLNDISAAAWYFSTIIQEDRFLVVTVSSGIGSKIYDKNNKLGVIDDIPIAGEIGHHKINWDGFDLKCDCGGQSHLGAISSGRGTERYARIMAEQDKENFSKSLCKIAYGADSNTLNNEEHLIPAALENDVWSKNIISKCSEPLARALITITLAVGIKKIAIIGGFAGALGQIYLENIKNQMIHLCDYFPANKIIENIIYFGEYPQEPCLEGAGVYYFNKVLANE